MRFKDALPDIQRLSIVAAVIMLAFSLTQLVTFTPQQISIEVFGILLDFSLNFSTLTIFLTAVLAAAGMEWLIQSHPDYGTLPTRWFSIRHWIVPVLTTLVIGVALDNFSGGPLWWSFFGLGSLLLMAVFVAEYNVVHAGDENHPLATIGLTALSFALFLLLALSVYSANLRLYIRLPLLILGSVAVISRSLYLRLGEWQPIWALVSSLIVSEIAIGFHYLPVTPPQFGLILVGIAYALTSIITGIKESRREWALWAEPVGMLSLLLIVSVFWF
jgi:hypothetical protein